MTIATSHWTTLWAGRRGGDRTRGRLSSLHFEMIDNLGDTVGLGGETRRTIAFRAGTWLGMRISMQRLRVELDSRIMQTTRGSGHA
jgi:hypothetical protein